MRFQHCPACGASVLAYLRDASSGQELKDQFWCAACNQAIWIAPSIFPGPPLPVIDTADPASPQAALAACIAELEGVEDWPPPSCVPVSVDAGSRVMNEDESEIPCVIQGRGGRLAASMRVDQGFNLCVRVDDGKRQDFWAEVKTEASCILFAIAFRLNELLTRAQKGGVS